MVYKVNIEDDKKVENTKKLFFESNKEVENKMNIYKSKISNVPTPGYSGHTSIFIKPVSYLNKDKVLNENLTNQKNDFDEYNLPTSFLNSINTINIAEDQVNKK
jgi:hypothetical protein